MIIWANLDQEARWAGIQLKPDVIKLIRGLSDQLAALAPAGEPLELWRPGDGAPPRWDLAWADPDAKAVNDRRFALGLGFALPGARVVSSLAELDAHITELGPIAWVCKAPWTAAGRDRCLGEGAPTADRRTRIERLLASFGALVFEPWLDRILDVGVCASIDRAGAVTAHPPHQLRTTPHGGFAGIDLAPPALEPAELDQLAAAVTAAGAALHRAGYAGPFGIDAFAYRVRSTVEGRSGSIERSFHPLCELNARHTFGHVARGYALRAAT